MSLYHISYLSKITFSCLQQCVTSFMFLRVKLVLEGVHSFSSWEPFYIVENTIKLHFSWCIYTQVIFIYNYISGQGKFYLSLMCYFEGNNFSVNMWVVWLCSNIYLSLDLYWLCSKIEMVKELLEGIHLVASLEAISLGTKAGIHPWIIYDIISNAAGNSWCVFMHIKLYIYSLNDQFSCSKVKVWNTSDNIFSS